MWAIRLNNEPVQFQGDKEIMYNSEAEAKQALADEITKCEQACSLGYIEDEGDWNNYKIVEVK